MAKLVGLGVIVKVRAGNIDVHLSKPLVRAIIREYHRHLERATDDVSVDVVLKAPVRIPMDAYEGPWDGVARRLRYPAEISPYLSHLLCENVDKTP